MGGDEDALIGLWQEKRGEAEPADLSGELVVQLGLATEDLNRAWYERAISRSCCIRTETGDIAAWPRQAFNKTGAHRIGDKHEHDRYGACGLEQRPQTWAASGQNDIRRERNQVSCVLAHGLSIARRPARFDLHVLAKRPARLLETLQERADALLCIHVVRGQSIQHADTAHLLTPLRACGERPCRPEHSENPAASCSPLGSGRNIVPAQTSTLIGLNRASLLQHEMLADVAHGSIATEVSGRRAARCPLCLQ